MWRGTGAALTCERLDCTTTESLLLIQNQKPDPDFVLGFYLQGADLDKGVASLCSIFKKFEI